MPRKTERLYANARFDGTTKADAVESFETALNELALRAEDAGRDVLYDTLEISIERDTVDERTMSEMLSGRSTTFVSILVNAEAILVSGNPEQQEVATP